MSARPTPTPTGQFHLQDAVITKISVFVNEVCRLIVRKMNDLLSIPRKNTNQPTKTIKVCELQSAIKIVLGESLAKYAISEGSKNTSAIRIFPVATIRNMIRVSVTAGTRVGNDVVAYMAAALEYIISDILDMAGSEALLDEVVIIDSSHMTRVFENDDGLTSLMRTLAFRFDA